MGSGVEVKFGHDSEMYSENLDLQSDTACQFLGLFEGK
jgi:hypothetical protein